MNVSCDVRSQSTIFCLHWPIDPLPLPNCQGIEGTHRHSLACYLFKPAFTVSQPVAFDNSYKIHPSYPRTSWTIWKQSNDGLEMVRGNRAFETFPGVRADTLHCMLIRRIERAGKMFAKPFTKVKGIKASAEPSFERLLCAQIGNSQCPPVTTCRSYGALERWSCLITSEEIIESRDSSRGIAFRRRVEIPLEQNNSTDFWCGTKMLCKYVRFAAPPLWPSQGHAIRAQFKQLSTLNASDTQDKRLSRHQRVERQDWSDDPLR